MFSVLFISGWNVNVRCSGTSQCTARNYEAICNYFGKENIETISMFDSISKLDFLEKLKRKICMLLFYRWPGLTSQIESKILKKIIEKDLVFINESHYGKLAEQIKKKCPKIKIVTFFHNIEYDCAREEHSKTIIHLWLARHTIFRNESCACKFSDIVITLNSRDSRLLQNIYNRVANEIIPISLPSKQINYNHSAVNEVPVGLFLGVDVYTNIHGIKWFIQKVLPNVHARLIIIGRGMDKIDFSRSDKLETYGYVEDLEPYMQKVDFMIFPIFKGGGMKVKTCEALMHGKNIIGTNEAFTGYEVDFGKIGACCETADEFIAAINEFPKKFRSKFNQYSRDLFIEKYSDEVVFKQFANAFNNMKQSSDTKKVKILAYFLPQFYVIPENEEWWGKGFTEWTNVRKENKVSKNLQPLNGNYYNLLEENTMLWQTKLAEQYGVYGFVYYHYYFCGKKLLEKPAENLLNNKNINQKFCFCWANHSWNRSWKGSRELLLKQEYSDEKEWNKHFNYLLPFFKDERYIKIDNKPLFIIFNGNFKEKEAMYKFFNKSACENGFNGVFFTESLHEKKQIEYISNSSSAVIIREPFYSSLHYRGNFFIRCTNKIKNKIRRVFLKIFKFKFLLLKYNGDRIARHIVRNSRNFCKDMRGNRIKCFLGAFSGWDNTSRHGIRGYKITPISDKNYIWYLSELKKIAEQEDMEFIFFNAWNEWAEGMILEPDTKNEYRFLEGIKQVFTDFRK